MANPPLDAIVIHYALRNKKFMLELSKSVKAAYFGPQFQEFYAVLHGAFLDPRIKEVLSLPAFLDYCESKDLGGQRDLFRNIYEYCLNAKLDGQEVADNDFPYFLKKLKERYNSVVLRNATTQVAEAIRNNQPLAEINALFESTVRDVHAIHRGEVFDEGSVGEDAINMYEEYKAVAADPDVFKGVPSGFVSLDSRTNGFFGGELIIVAGFEGTGKSLLCMNMAVNAWLGSNKFGEQVDDYLDDGHNVVYFSLEMPRSNRGEFTSGAYLNKRILSCLGGVPFTELRKGQLEPEDEQKLVDACKFIGDYDKIKKFYVVDIPRGATVQDIEVKYLELQEKFNVDLIVIDYIGLMAGAEDESDWEAQGHIAAGLHEFARLYNVPVISPVQVNRPSGANHSLNKQNYNTTRVARSKMITENANIVLQIECRDQEREYVDMPVHIIKMRDGDQGTLTFSKDFARMRVLDDLVPDDPMADLLDFEDLGME